MVTALPFHSVNGFGGQQVCLGLYLFCWEYLENEKLSLLAAALQKQLPVKLAI